MNNITIEGFNTAASNLGMCHFTNVTFRKNCMHYFIDESNGGAIRNHNFLNCVNCTFDGNEARFGDAIYNDPFSSSTLADCIFVNSNSWAIISYPGKLPQLVMRIVFILIITLKPVMGLVV